jgi:hypothetical protein
MEKITLTREEKAEIRKENRRKYQREYMKTRLATDDGFYKKQQEVKQRYAKTRYENDPVYRQKQIDDYKARYAKYRDAFLESTKTSVL